jgi:6-pyruvoyltetrahydropterin/6-carboxytetrahydropterin synthase
MFTSDGLDNGQMVMDFGLMKGTIKDLVDSFDHAYSMWDKESTNFQDFIHNNSDRWISMPVSPSAESYSLMFFFIIDKLISATQFNNGEKQVSLSSVRVHETDTGYAESFRDDLEFWNFELSDIKFSDQIKSEWHDPKMYDKLIDYTSEVSFSKPFINPIVEHQI